MVASMVQCSKDEGILRVKVNFIDWKKMQDAETEGTFTTDFDPSVAAKTRWIHWIPHW